MDYGHPLRFGALAAAGDGSPRDAVETAVLGEELGLDLVAFPDPAEQGPDGWTLLSWAAARTRTIGLTATLNAALRPPAVVARAAAGLDLLTGGRVELTLDAHATVPGTQGLTSDAVAAAGEAIDVIRGIWSAADDSPLHVEGRHHQVKGAERGPAPAHTIPLWLAARDAPALRLTGEKADGWLTVLDADPAQSAEPGNGGAAGPAWAGRVARLRERQALIDAAATAGGRDPREIRRLAVIPGTGATPDKGWVDALLPLVMEAGLSTFLLDTGDPAALRGFGEEVVPVLREAVAAERALRGTVVGVPPGRAVRSRRHPGIDYDRVPASLARTAVEPGDAAYPDVRSTYVRGGAPGLVLRPGSPSEVADALAFARAQPVGLSLRSGGHGISGRSTNRGGIVIDLGRLNTIEVLDEATRLVRVGPGARWGEVAAALAPYGWALSSGDYGGVGVGGLATAGGIGWLARAHGLTIDHLRAAELVLADGSHVRADANEHPDLLWAVRGAGAGFGAVTAFEFQADEVGDIGFAQLVFDASDTAGFLERWGATIEAAPRALTAFLIIGGARPGQPLIAQAMAVVDSDDPDTVIDLLQPLAATAPLLDHSVRILPYQAIMHAPSGPHHGQGEPVSRSALAEHLTPGLAAAAARLVGDGTSYFFQIRSVGGAVADVPPEATAYAHRSANFSLVAFGSSRTRLDRAWDAMSEHFTGLYTTFETDRRPERLTDAYPPATLRRLRELKRRYDPGNVFRDNFVIDPAE
ncbi:LLM class flavin-dependent oxidoreductase [Nonomuraea sp. NN258]|uniref:LLM class flavin-dependent oxidoreductase n=1 Tax=Nonomuraea antri TaxID=2730852 RepID=UPI0015699C44|nr:LLM class flavin-dependent oxidoreductase [Nonomuraea antri]NRQ34243.1 LLM class flavin-dependent oxidoreductase [Nonomuraea antri]